MDGEIQVVGLAPCREDNRYLIIRGSKSRNKVAVGEPAAGSFFRCLQKYLKNKKTRGGSKRALLTLEKHFFAARLFVEHGSHNVSRWMTWLSISLKNAAACDKWYQLQNHFITESLNANGAWEKPFVGHPRACHTQCRTNKKKKQERKFFFLSLFFFQNKSPGSGEAGVFVLPARPFGLVFAVRVGRCLATPFYPFTSREAGAAKRVPKETLRFLFAIINSYLVYRPEHGRTTR